MAKKDERDRWRNVPEWKKQLILDKEKKKQQEMVRRVVYNDCNFWNYDRPITSAVRWSQGSVATHLR